MAALLAEVVLAAIAGQKLDYIPGTGRPL